jgi:hypothetical protein
MSGANDLNDTSGSGPPQASGTEAFLGVVCFAGTSQAAAVLKWYVPTQAGAMPVYTLPSGATTLTASIMTAGLIQSTSPGATELVVPTLSSMGFTYDENLQRSFPVQRHGDGVLAVNADTGMTLTDPNDVDPVNLAKDHPWVWVVYDANDSAHYE